MSYDARSSQLNAYRETRIRTAGQGQMIVMLYDEVIKQLDEAVSLLDQDTRKLDTVHNAIVKSQECITELTVGLDLEKGGQLAQTLFDLYRYFHSELTDANMQKDPARLRAVRRMMNELRTAWVQIVTTHSAPSEEGLQGRPASGGGVNFAG